MDNIKKDHLNPGGLGPLCFSMNSLDAPTKGLKSPTQQNITLPATHSLNRRLRRKAENRDAACRSWGSVDEDGNKEFWASIEEPYNFIMSSQLVPDAYDLKEKSEFPASSEMELSWDMDDISPSYVWNFSRFLDQYNELYEWLIQVQVELYNPSIFNDKIARVARQEELKQQAYRKKLFVEQSDQVMRQFPENKDDISWRVNYLTNKWEQLEMAFTPKGRKKDVPAELDLEHEEKVLKDWLCTMEGHIQPITCRLPKGCSIQTLQERYKEIQILLKDIKAHGPILTDVIRQYEERADKKEGNDPLQLTEQKSETPTFVEQGIVTTRQKKKRIPRRVGCLEKRWQQIYLRSLEWHYYLEGVIGNFKNYPASCSSESDDEPVTKCRKISFNSSVSSGSPAPRITKGWSDYENHGSENGSYIEHVDEGIAGAKSHVKDDYVAHTLHLGSPQLLVKSECDSLCLEPMLIEDQQDCAEKVLQTENEQDTLIELAAEEDNLFDMRNRDQVNCNETAKELPVFTSVEKTAPNCGSFEYKHQECDVEKVVADIDMSPTIPRRLQPLTTWKNSQKRHDDLDVDEDAVQAGLQKIIDDAIHDEHWLNSNMPTDSESSVGSRRDLLEDCMDTNNEEFVANVVDGTTSSSSTNKLIKGAENLVRDSDVLRDTLKPLPLGENSCSKQRRIQKWISQQRDQSTLQDSCDASGELTTGESDVESNSSEKVRCVLGRKYLSSSPVDSFDKTPTAESLQAFSSSTPKLNSRGRKRRQSDQRPWSITDVAQIPIAHHLQELNFLKQVMGDKRYDEVLRVHTSSKNISSSESALNHIKGSSSDTAVEGRMSTSTSFEPFGTSFEETVIARLQCAGLPNAEESKIYSPSITCGDAGVSNSRSSTASSSLKRRKIRVRRKSNIPSGRRTFGSESDESSKRISGREERLVQANQSVQYEAYGFSDLSSIKQISQLNESSTVTKMFDTLEVPSCQLPVRCEVRTPISDIDAGTAPEDVPLSEQAWDPYQDTKYLSEPYSEDVDHDAARKLQEFGDDYRKYIDSDGSSLIGRPTRPGRGRKPRPHGSVWSTSEFDSDSDLEFIQHMLNQSKNQLCQAENAFRRSCNDPTISVDLQVVMSTANNNLEALKKFTLALQKEGLVTEMKEAKGLVKRWEALQAEAMERDRELSLQLKLQMQMKAFKMSLEEIDNQCEASVRLSSFDGPTEFQQKIKIAKEFLSAVAERREDLTALNVSVHKFLSDSKLTTTATLKDELDNIYQLWDDSQHRIEGKIAKLEGAQTIWRLWEKQKMDLQMLLKQDSDRLKVLDKAMQTGNMTDMMASNSQCVARLLNDRRNIGLSNRNPQVSIVNTKCGDITKLRSRMGGCASDSGTSGYESCSSDDLSERERRLADLRRLARDLETTLVPGSKAYSEVSETIADAEKQLSSLQKQCRELIVRSTISSDENELSRPYIENLNGIKPLPLAPRKILKSSKENTWIWRIVRTAIPLQAAILLLLCVACLLEPNCCDSANTLNFNISPQLRFINGPPPV